MFKWLILIFIIPNLLFGKLYSVETQTNSSHNHRETYSNLSNSASSKHYLYVHEHEHENGICSHAHSHIHVIKIFNPTDSFLFFMEEDNIVPALNDHIIASVDIFILSNITQDLFRPPIA